MQYSLNGNREVFRTEDLHFPAKKNSKNHWKRLQCYNRQVLVQNDNKESSLKVTTRSNRFHVITPRLHEGGHNIHKICLEREQHDCTSTSTLFHKFVVRIFMSRKEGMKIRLERAFSIVIL